MKKNKGMYLPQRVCTPFPLGQFLVQSALEVYYPIWMEKYKMATLKEEAQAYEAPQTLNIADLDKIPIDLEVKEGEGKDKDGEVFKYRYATIEGKDYRIAGSILGGIKAILGKMPDLKYVAVLKTGSGMNTRYQVIPFNIATVAP